jgi:hypothetical protein
MSKLSEELEAVLGMLHHGPSVEPFHQAVVAAHDALDKRVAELEAGAKDMYEALENFLGKASDAVVSGAENVVESGSAAVEEKAMEFKSEVESIVEPTEETVPPVVLPESPAAPEAAVDPASEVTQTE